MNSKRTNSSALTFIALICLFVAGAALMSSHAAPAPVAEAAPDNPRSRMCTNASLKGNYGFTAQGVTLHGSPVPPALQGPFASGGKATFDGEGNFTLTATSSFNGVVQGPVTLRGTYSVSEDCTYTSQAENGATFRSVIVDGGLEIFIIQTTTGVAITGTAKKL